MAEEEEQMAEEEEQMAEEEEPPDDIRQAADGEPQFPSSAHRFLDERIVGR